MDGEIVYMFIYNTGTKFTDDQLRGLLKNQEDFSKYEYQRPTPEEIPTFTVPSIFNLRDETLESGKFSRKIRSQASIYNTGSFSIRLRYAFSGLGVKDIYDLTFDPAFAKAISDLSAKEKSKVEKNLSKIANVEVSQIKETYRFYHINASVGDIMPANGKAMAGLLIDEHNYSGISDAYANDTLKKSISYTSGDAVFVGWEAAVMIDTAPSYEHELLVAEIANVQLLEMMVYHDRIAKVIRDTEGTGSMLSKSGLRSKGLARTNRSLGESYNRIRDMINSVNDTVSGFGEWYLLKLYSLYDDVFKISAWRDSLEDDMDLIDKRRAIISDAIRSNRDEFLEIIVILLIVVEVVVEVIFLLSTR